MRLRLFSPAPPSFSVNTDDPKWGVRPMAGLASTVTVNVNFGPKTSFRRTRSTESLSRITTSIV